MFRCRTCHQEGKSGARNAEPRTPGKYRGGKPVAITRWDIAVYGRNTASKQTTLDAKLPQHANRARQLEVEAGESPESKRKRIQRTHFNSTAHDHSFGEEAVSCVSHVSELPVLLHHDSCVSRPICHIKDPRLMETVNDPSLRAARAQAAADFELGNV